MALLIDDGGKRYTPPPAPKTNFNDTVQQTKQNNTSTPVTQSPGNNNGGSTAGTNGSRPFIGPIAPGVERPMVPITPVVVEPPFPELDDPVSQSLINKLPSNKTTNGASDPQTTKQDNVVEAAAGSYLWGQEANRLKEISDEKRTAVTDAANTHGVGSKEHIAAQADQSAAESAYLEAMAKSDESWAELNVYASDPAYDPVMSGAENTINDALNPHGLKFTMPEGDGDLTAAQNDLNERREITQLATQARQDFEAAKGAIAQVPDSYVPGSAYTPFVGPVASIPGGNSREVINATSAHNHAQSTSHYNEALLRLTSGNKNLADMNVRSLEANRDLTVPGSPERKAIDDALPAARQQLDLAESNLNGIQAHSDLAKANELLTGVKLDQQALTERALADARQRGDHWFDPNGYTNGRGKYTGKIVSQRTEVDEKTGQLFMVTEYEHVDPVRIQLTFPPGERNRGSDSENRLDQDWQNFMSGKGRVENQCITNIVDYAQKRLAGAQENIGTQQIADLDNYVIPQLQQAYDDAVEKHGGASGNTGAGGTPSNGDASNPASGPGLTPTNYPGTPTNNPVHPDVAEAWNNLEAARTQRDAIAANNDWLGFLQTQPLTNYGLDQYNESLQAKYFATRTEERQREFNRLHEIYGAPVDWSAGTERNNGVGIALQIPPANAEAVRAGDVNTEWFSDEQREIIKPVTDKIQELGGDNAKVQVLPAYLAMNDGGLYKTALFAVTGENGERRIVDETGRDYSDIDDYRENHRLPGEGKLYLPEDLDFSADGNGDARIRQIDIEKDNTMMIVDGAVGVVTGIATIASFTPAAPVAAPIALIGGTYLGGRSAMRLHDMHEHGESLTSKQGLMEMGMVATSALPVVGSTTRLAGLAGRGMYGTSALRTSIGAVNSRTAYAADAALVMQEGRVFQVARGMDYTAMGIGLPMMGVSSYDMAVNWDQMSDFDKFNNALGFVGGLYGTGQGGRQMLAQRNFNRTNRTQPTTPTPDTPPPAPTRTPPPPTTIKVRNPETGDIVDAHPLTPETRSRANGLTGADGVLDGSQILPPGQRLSDVYSGDGGNPKFHLVPDTSGAFHLLPIIAGGSESPLNAGAGETPSDKAQRDRSATNRLDELRAKAQDGHIHTNPYPHIPDRPGTGNVPKLGDVRHLLRLTGNLNDPAQGPILALQPIPQAIPKQAPYYLGTTTAGGTTPQQFTIKLHSDGTWEIPPFVKYFSEGMQERTIPPARFGLGNRDGYLWGTPDIDPPLPPQRGEPPKEFTVNIIPDLEMTFRGAQRDRSLIDEIMYGVPDEWAAQRILVGSAAGDPANMGNLGNLLGTLNYINQKEGSNPGKIRKFGLAEWTLSKEGVIINLGEKPDLSNPVAIHQLLNAVGKMGGTVVVHTDAGTPNMIQLPTGERLLLHTESNHANVEPLLKIFEAHPDTNIVWAHAGGLGRSGYPPAAQLRMLREQVLQNPKLNHVMIDMSWDVVSAHVLRTPESTRAWAQLVREHPDRFLYGSDSVAAKNQETVHSALEAYHESGFFDLIGPENTDLFLFGNFDRVFVQAADRVTAWRLANKEWLKQFPWEQGPDGGVAADPFGPNSPLGDPNAGGRLLLPGGDSRDPRDIYIPPSASRDPRDIWLPAGAEIHRSQPGAETPHTPPTGEAGSPQGNRAHAIGAGVLGLGALDSLFLAAPGDQAAPPILDWLNPMAEANYAAEGNNEAFAGRGAMIVLKALYGEKLPSLAADKPLGMLLRGGLLSTYAVNDTVFTQWLLHGGLNRDPSVPLPIQLMEQAFIVGFGVGNGFLTGTTAAELVGGAKKWNWNTNTTQGIRATGLSFLTLASPLWATHTGMQAIEQFAQGRPLTGSALTAATMMQGIFTAAVGKTTVNEWAKAFNKPVPGAKHVTMEQVMLGASLFFATGIQLGLAITNALDKPAEDDKGKPSGGDPSSTPTPTPSDSPSNSPTPSPSGPTTSPSADAASPDPSASPSPTASLTPSPTPSPIPRNLFP